MVVVEGAMERKQNNLFSLKSCHANKPQFLQLKKNNVYSQIQFFPLFFFLFDFESLQFRIRHAVVHFQISLTNIALVYFVEYSSLIKLLANKS